MGIGNRNSESNPGEPEIAANLANSIRGRRWLGIRGQKIVPISDLRPPNSKIPFFFLLLHVALVVVVDHATLTLGRGC